MGIEQAILFLEDEFYSSPEQEASRHVSKYQASAQLNVPRYLRREPAWRITQSRKQKAERQKKPILWTDYGFSEVNPEKITPPQTARLTLIRDLISQGFEVSILNKNGSLQKIDCSQYASDQRILDFITKANFYRKPSATDRENPLESDLSKAGGGDLQHWNILDHYAVEKICSLKVNGTQNPFIYESSLEKANKNKSWMRLEKIDYISVGSEFKQLRNVEELLHSPSGPYNTLPVQLFVWYKRNKRPPDLKDIPVAALILKSFKDSAPVSVPKTLKNLKLLRSDVAIHTEGKLEDLTLVASDLRNLSELKHLKKINFLSSPKKIIDNLPSSLEEILLYSCETPTSIELSHCSKLTKLTIRLSGEARKSELQVTIPPSLEHLEMGNSTLKVSGSLAACKKLKTLRLYECGCDTRPLLESLPQTLEVMDLPRNIKVPSNFDLSHTQLKKLSLSNIHGLQKLSLPSSLEELTLEKAYTSTLLLDLSHCKKLKKLILDSSVDLSRLAFPDSLEEIELTCGLRERQSMPDFSHLKGLKKLKILSFSSADINNIPRSLEYLKITTYVSIEEMRNVPLKPKNDAFDVSRLDQLKNLKRLEMNVNLFSRTFKLPENLEYLELRNNYITPRIDTSAVKGELEKIIEKTEGSSHSEPADRKPLSHLDQASSSIPLDDKTNTSPTKKLPVTYAIYRRGLQQEHKLEAIAPARYRQSLHDQFIGSNNQIQLSCSENKSKENYRRPLNNLKNVKGFSQSEIHRLKAEHFLVTFPLQRSTNWVPLPGLSPHDKITQIALPEGSELRINCQTQQYEIYWPLEEQKSKEKASTSSTVLHYIFELDPMIKSQDVGVRHKLPREVTGQLEALFNLSCQLTYSSAFKLLHQALNEARKTSNRTEFCQTTLADYFRQFTAGDLSTTKRGLLAKILLEQKGVCRHRALAYVALCQWLGVPARLVSNEIHAFAEIHNGTTWESIDLGGGVGGQLQFSPPPIEYRREDNQPLVGGDAKVSFPLAQASSASSPYAGDPGIHAGKSVDKAVKASGPDAPPDPTVDPAIKSRKQDDVALPNEWLALLQSSSRVPAPPDILKYLSAQKKCLLQIPDLATGRGLYKALTQELKEEKSNSIYYLQSAKQLREDWHTYSVTEGGAITRSPGKLQKFIQEGSGLLIINWAGFSAGKIGAYMSINDEIRKLKGTQIPENLRVLNLVTADTPAGDRFYSRSPRVAWPNDVPLPEPVLWSMPKDDKRDFSPESTEFIHLDPKTWKAQLIGTLGTNEAGGVQWFEGALARAVAAGKSRLVLVDPPLSDPDFQRFMTQLDLERCFEANGEIIRLPDDFVWQFAPAPEYTETTQLEPHTEIDPELPTCYVPSTPLETLTQRQQILEGGKLVTKPNSWLTETDQKDQVRQIVSTKTYTPKEKHALHQALKEQKRPVRWIDRSAKARPPEVKEKKGETKAQIPTVMESVDPTFTAQRLADQEGADLCLPIHQGTQSNELFEQLTPVEQDPDKPPIFTQTVRRVLEQLRQGKTVVLYGSLSDSLYQLLEPLLSEHPQFKLSSDVHWQPIKGRLFVVTTPVNFEPSQLAPISQNQQQPDSLWEAYKARLEKDCPVKDYPQRDSHLRQIQLFYQAAAKIPHNVVGTPPLLRLNYQRLRHWLECLKSPPDKDNPVKAFFHHDYDHRSEAYAYLNVLAKHLFGPQERKASEPRAQVRRYKLAQYPADPSYLWRRLNCLNAAALAALWPDLSHSSLPPQTYGPDHHLLHFQLQSWLDTPNYQYTPAQKDPQAKLARQLQKALAAHNIVTLKGEPGSGKTFAALQYIAEQKGQRKGFLGKRDLRRWLKSEPKAGEESVLVLDEANLERSGTWDFLAPLLAAGPSKGPSSLFYQGEIFKVSSGHKVIFTCNPEHYPSRSYHEILQDSPQLYVKSWTPETLGRYVVDPLLETQLSRRLDAKEEKELMKLLRAIQITRHLLSSAEVPGTQALSASAPLTSEYLSVRDIQQLILRVLHHSQQPQGITPQAAYEAVILEWGQRFSDPKKIGYFQQQMQQLFEPESPHLNQFAVNKNALTKATSSLQGSRDPVRREVKHSDPSDPDPSIPVGGLADSYYFGPKQLAWWATLHENLQLAQQHAHTLNPLDGSPLIKAGTLLEGESGTGKTTLARLVLKDLGYQELDAEKLLELKEEKGDKDPDRIFIQFTPSDDLNEDKKLLLKAFHCGAVVVLDELNLAPTLEKYLNQLLTGKTTSGNKARHPGFYVIASQNSSLHLGNKPSSLALKNRFHTLSTYLTPQDLVATAEAALTVKLERRQQLAKALVNRFEQQRAQQPRFYNVRNFMQDLDRIRRYCLSSKSPEEQEIDPINDTSPQRISASPSPGFFKNPQGATAQRAHEVMKSSVSLGVTASLLGSIGYGSMWAIDTGANTQSVTHLHALIQEHAAVTQLATALFGSFLAIILFASIGVGLIAQKKDQDPQPAAPVEKVV